MYTYAYTLCLCYMPMQYANAVQYAVGLDGTHGARCTVHIVHGAHGTRSRQERECGLYFSVDFML